MNSLHLKTTARILILIGPTFACAGSPVCVQADDFLLRDNDTVVFFGDSITAARGYTKTIEHYALMRYPDRKMRFYNAGKGGDTAQTSVARLQRDVFDRQASVMLIALGVNDIGWGARADDAHKQLYLDGIRTLVERCAAKEIRVIVCSPAITSESPDTAETNFLQTMADEGLDLARSLGAKTVDVQRGMRELQRPIVEFNAKQADRAKHVTLHAADGIHLSDLGQLAMAFAILKGLGAPDLVSSATIDAATGAVAAANGCSVTKVERREAGIAFTRHDSGSPLNRGVFSSFDHRWVPIPDQLNRYELNVANLPQGTYTIRAAGRLLGTVTAERLAVGINLASMTDDAWEPGGPWNVQSDVVKQLVDARDLLLYGNRLQITYGADHSESESLREGYKDLDARLVEQQRRTARPRPYRCEIKKTE